MSKTTNKFVLDVRERAVRIAVDMPGIEKMIDNPGTAKIWSLSDWRGDLLSHIRQAIKNAAPAIVEAIKWRKTSAR